MRLLLAVLLLLPGAQAVGWEDPGGDHEMGAFDTWAAAPPGWYPMGDVLRIEMTEVDARLVRLEVEAASLDPGPDPVGSNPVMYALQDKSRSDNATWAIVEESSGYWVWFIRDLPYGDGSLKRPERLTGEPLERDGNILSGFLHKSSFVSLSPPPAMFLEPLPRAGHSVELTPVVAPSFFQRFANRVDLRDEVGAPQTMVFQIEEERRGDLWLFVEKPYRSSNGAATTYLYDVVARNDGSDDETARVTVSAPPTWVMRAPYEITVPAGQTVTFPVAATVPFRHEHGKFETATVQTVASDGTEARVDVHVVWHDPPAPGGHHRRVALDVSSHGFPQFGTGPAPSSGTAAPWERQTDSVGPLRDIRALWRFWLQPYRTVGLDFDASGEVTGRTTFEVPQASDVRLTGRLILSDPRLVVAEQVHELSWESGQHDVTWNMPLAKGVDVFPPDEGGNLAFEFVLEHTAIDPSAGVYGQTAPKALVHLADNWFDLPLSDYHEDVDLAAIGLARLSLRTPENARLVNPQETIVIPFHVTNHDVTSRRLEWTLDTPADWITMQPPPARLEPGENASFVVVASPGDLPDGTVAQVLVVARDVETGIESFGRVAVTVTRDQDAPNEAYLVPDDPGPKADSPLPVALVLLAIGAVARRPGR